MQWGMQTKQIPGKLSRRVRVTQSVSVAVKHATLKDDTIAQIGTWVTVSAAPLDMKCPSWKSHNLTSPHITYAGLLKKLSFKHWHRATSQQPYTSTLMTNAAWVPGRSFSKPLPMSSKQKLWILEPYMGLCCGQHWRWILLSVWGRLEWEKRYKTE